jgi:hypothetical protein
MTTTMEPRARVGSGRNGMLWNSMPGWGITANLLPPEIVLARRVKVLRKLVLVAIGGVLLLGVAGYVYGYLQKQDANSQLSAAQAHTSQLTAQQAKYEGVVAVTGQISQVKSQLSTLFAADVNGAALLTSILQHAPHGTISTLTLTLSSGQPPSAVAIPDANGHLPIGTITLSGDTSAMSDVATSVDQLKSLPGLVEIYPTTQQYDGKSVKYTIQLTLIDQIYSHRYDFTPASVPTTGGK